MRSKSLAHFTLWTILLTGLVCTPATAQHSVFDSNDNDQAGSKISALKKSIIRNGSAKSSSEYVADADSFRDLREKSADSREKKDAMCAETELLLAAILAGDNSVIARAKKLVTEIQADTTISTGNRLYITSRYLHADAYNGSGQKGKSFLKMHEDIAKVLIKDFPLEPMPYRQLLMVAEGSNDEYAGKIVKEMQRFRLPDSVSSDFALLRSRLDLLGKMAAGIPMLRALPAQAGRPQIIYFWSANDTASIDLAFAAELAAPAGAQMVGINIDTDGDAARRACKQEGLKAHQVYDSKGAGQSSKQELYAAGGGIIYIVNSSGIISCVSAHNDLLGSIKTWCK